MKRFGLTILIIIFAFSACSKSGSSGSGGFGFFSDDTEKVVEIIKDANQDLHQVKVLYRDNQGRVDELKSAIGSKDAVKVKKIADELVTKIKEGISLGEIAYNKIEEAEKMNINQTYKEYLGLKKDSLRKLLDAFESRQQAAEILRDGFGSKDPKVLEKTLVTFKEKEENFKKLKDEGLELSQDARQLAIEATKNK
jgi:hypothetical protein